MRSLYAKLTKPRATTEDKERREFILNILLLGVSILAGGAFLSALISRALLRGNYNGPPLIAILMMFITFAGLYALARKGFYRAAAYPLVAIMFLLTTYTISIWGVLLPQGILMYSLLIVIVGVLLTSRAALQMTALIVAVLLLIVHLESVGVIHFDTTWLQQKGGYNDVIVYGFTFTIVAVVSWLSNREIERSLLRARRSERELREERNSLDVKVRERTRELEEAQVEKMMQLHRFAEFGRFSSTLLHDLADPLTSVSLGLEQLETKQRSKLLKDVREGIAYMESYVTAARRQLRNQSEIKLFDVATEIKRVSDLLATKAKNNHVHLTLELLTGLQLRGDSIHFNQIIANLVSNAIDASSQPSGVPFKVVTVRLKQQQGSAVICVMDQGVGITADELPKIFEPFYTTKNVERGTGIGLAITKRLVEEDFNGTITVDSSEKGTSFKVVIVLS